MKSLLILAALALAPAAASAADDPSTYISADKVTEGFQKGGTIARANDFYVQTSRRDKAGNHEMHAVDSEIMYVVDGSATVVTGGKMIGAKEGKNGNSTGTGVEGGEVHRLSKGDVLVVPRGTPHWFKEVPSSINYYVVKVPKQ